MFPNPVHLTHSLTAYSSVVYDAGWAQQTTVVGATRPRKSLTISFSRVDTQYTSDGLTDRQTQSRRRLCISSRGEKKSRNEWRYSSRGHVPIVSHWLRRHCARPRQIN